MENEIYPSIIEETKETKKNDLYKIRPSEIKFRNSDCVGFFSKQEIEEAAGLLVKFFQKKEIWCSFKIEEVKEFCKTSLGVNISEDDLFYGLYGSFIDDIDILLGRKSIAPLYIVRVEEEYFITSLFIKRCLEEPK